MSQEMNLSVSPVCEKDGQKCAYVSFSDGQRTADGIIPDCKIISSKGFSEEEVAQLEGYMQSELAKLKRMAAGIRLFDVLTK